MNTILAALDSLSFILAARDLRHLALIIEATLSMTGRVTMLGISRWTEKGGSYRTVQRFFGKTHDWAKLRWLLVKSHYGANPPGTWIVTGDEVVVTKSGKDTFGLGRFFSSIQNQPVPSVCFLNISLVHVESRNSYPLVAEQLVRQEVKDSAPKTAGQTTATGKGGRPKGSKNKNRADVALSPFQLQLQSCIRQALNLVNGDIRPSHFVYDGALGNNGGLQLARQTGLHIISKLRHDSTLYFPYAGGHSGKGKPKKYGDRLTLDKLKHEHLRSDETEKGIRTLIYQVSVWHKTIPSLINVVVIAKTNLATGKSAKVLLFSGDLELTHDQLVDYYRLRFQIEFNFRDAKQYWGLEDFMNIKQEQVNNAANFSLFMVTFSQLLLQQLHDMNIGSMLDLKTIFRARKYTRRIINSIGINAEKFLIDDQIFEAAEIGRIHAKAA